MAASYEHFCLARNNNNNNNNNNNDDDDDDDDDNDNNSRTSVNTLAYQLDTASRTVDWAG